MKHILLVLVIFLVQIGTSKKNSETFISDKNELNAGFHSLSEITWINIPRLSTILKS